MNAPKFRPGDKVAVYVKKKTAILPSIVIPKTIVTSIASKDLIVMIIQSHNLNPAGVLDTNWYTVAETGPNRIFPEHALRHLDDDDYKTLGLSKQLERS